MQCAAMRKKARRTAASRAAAVIALLKPSGPASTPAKNGEVQNLQTHCKRRPWNVLSLAISPSQNLCRYL